MSVMIAKVNIIARRFDETLAFYRRFGLDIPEVYGQPAETRHVPATDGVADFAIDNVALARLWMSGPLLAVVHWGALSAIAAARVWSCATFRSNCWTPRLPPVVRSPGGRRDMSVPQSHDDPLGAADVVVDARWDSGAPKDATLWRDGHAIGRRAWEEDGTLWLEHGLHNGRRHGPWREWHPNGVLAHETFWVDGREHGHAQQFARDGTLLGEYTMVHGTGLDLWFHDNGTVSEERVLRDGNRDGLERWWNDDGQTVGEERSFRAGQEHGIARQWNAAGRLARGYPAYFVNGRKVTKRQYVAAARADATLPPFRAEDNDPRRRRLQQDEG